MYGQFANEKQLNIGRRMGLYEKLSIFTFARPIGRKEGERPEEWSNGG